MKRKSQPKKQKTRELTLQQVGAVTAGALNAYLTLTGETQGGS